MSSFIIEGGHPLKGEITPQGAKNEALEVICAALLTPEEVIIRNIPDIRDVNNLILLLEDIGVKVKRLSRNEYSFIADELNLEYLESQDFVKKCSQLRGSVLMIGPLLARFGKAVIAKPGGDKIGRRRLDTHFLGFKYLGAEFRQVYNTNVYEIYAEKLTGCYMLLEVETAAKLGGFSIGKFSVSGGSSASGGADDVLSPTALSYLEPTGLLYRGI